MKEPQRYLRNAREILKKAPREGYYYSDVKPVREACGTAYLAVLEALNEYLLAHGLTRKELPKSFEQYQQTLHRYVSIHNGKLFREFNYLYDTLHIAGYYRALLRDVELVKRTLTLAQQFIGKLSR